MSPTHRRKGWRRALLGSIAESVLHHSIHSVLTLPPEADGQPKITSILCPVNFTDVGRLALEEAATLASTFGAELQVLYVAETEDAGFKANVERDFAAWIEPSICQRCRYAQLVVRFANRPVWMVPAPVMHAPRRIHQADLATV